MNKEELEKEAEQQAFEKYPLSDRCDRIDLEKNLKYEEGYIDGAEPRDKRIDELEVKLTKAKEIIENLLSDDRTMKAQFESEEQANVWFEHIHKAEQFLEEVGKEDEEGNTVVDCSYEMEI